MDSHVRAPDRRDTWFHARARAWKRAIARGIAAGNRVLDAIPPCRWAYAAQLFRTIDWSEIEMVVGPAHAGLDGLRAAFLSDLHAGSYVGERELDRLFTLVAERSPDLVLFGGDFVHTRRWEIDLFARPLQRLDPPFGVFAVPGNHERFRGLQIAAWRERVASFGVRVLENTGARIERGGSTLWLAGVDDLAEGEPDVAAALRGRRDGEPALMLSHHPDLWDEIATHDVALTLSGHTHGGQIAPFGFVPVRHSECGYDGGTFGTDRARLHVGRGIGAVILPLRIGARPEVPMVTIRARRSADG